MAANYNEKDIEALSIIHHGIYYKVLHRNYEDQFPRIKGLTPLEMGVLGVLSENPGAMLREIAEKLAVSKSTLTNVIDRLEGRNYVHRAISPKDQRSFELVLTEDGKCAQQEHIASEHGFYRKLIETLDSPEETAELIHLLQKVADRF